MNLNKMYQWLFNGEVGISSKTMASALIGIKYNLADMPYDADDFRRCYLFAQQAELTPEDFMKIVEFYPWWQHILDIWEPCAMALSNDDWKAVCDLLQSEKCHDAIQRELKHLKKISDGLWMGEGMANQLKKNYLI